MLFDRMFMLLREVVTQEPMKSDILIFNDLKFRQSLWKTSNLVYNCI